MTDRLPIIRISFEHMASQIHAMISQELVGMDEMVQKAVEDACDPRRIENMIQTMTDAVLRKAIHNEIEDFFFHGKGRTALRAAINKTLEHG
jgi:hypothetical protein